MSCLWRSRSNRLPTHLFRRSSQPGARSRRPGRLCAARLIDFTTNTPFDAGASLRQTLFLGLRCDRLCFLFMSLRASRRSQTEFDTANEEFSMGTMCMKIAHCLLPRARRIFVEHGQHPLDQVGSGPGIPGLFFRRDGANATGRIVARHAMRRRRARPPWRAPFPRAARVTFVIDVFHLLPAQTAITTTRSLCVDQPRRGRLARASPVGAIT